MSVAVPNSVDAAAISNRRTATEDDEIGPDGKKIRPGISNSIISELADCNTVLSRQRNKRQVPSTLAPTDAVERYTQLTVNPLHRANKGILSLDIQYSKDIATAGADSNAVVFDRPSGPVVSTLSGHTKKVTSVKFVGNGESVVAGSADKTVCLRQGSENGNYDCKHILKDHKAEVQAVTIHATSNYFVTASLDKTLCTYFILYVHANREICISLLWAPLLLVGSFISFAG
ncbi:hypothetical protein CDL12_27905 [Handroanthus impetiginosus]|uniref:Pre-mRNA-processing factor 19 n=1 Tax=Handroanthus impetiginosus TaxID=429701 RepID=A0A2G9G2T0_9LAMI|nr:hypothetical protein CDL12_27905 [Handroanthus impetiginosus]